MRAKLPAAALRSNHLRKLKLLTINLPRNEPKINGASGKLNPFLRASEKSSRKLKGRRGECSEKSRKTRDVKSWQNLSAFTPKKA
jgi:hypothetical protein